MVSLEDRRDTIEGDSFLSRDSSIWVKGDDDATRGGRDETRRRNGARASFER